MRSIIEFVLICSSAGILFKFGGFVFNRVFMSISVNAIKRNAEKITFKDLMEKQEFIKDCIDGVRNVLR